MERKWIDEVRYLHALWKQGPPKNPNLRPQNSTVSIKENKIKEKKENSANKDKKRRRLPASTVHVREETAAAQEEGLQGEIVAYEGLSVVEKKNLEGEILASRNVDQKKSLELVLSKASKVKKKHEITSKKDKKRRRQPDRPAPTVSEDVEWPCESPPEKPQETSWPPPKPYSTETRPLTAEELEKLTAMQIQKDAIKLCQEFFKRELSDEDDDVDPMDEDEDETSENFDFFLGLFTENGDLRGYYEKNWERGEFSCLVCRGTGVKASKKFVNCLALVQHSISISKKTVKRGSHRAFGRAVCRVLGWEVDRLPSIVLTLAEPLGRTLDQTNHQADVREYIVAVQKENTQGEIVASVGSDVVQKENIQGKIVAPEGSDVVQNENLQEDNVASPNVDQKENLQEDNVASPNVDQNENLELVFRKEKKLKRKQENTSKKEKKQLVLPDRPASMVSNVEWPCEPQPEKPQETSWPPPNPHLTETHPLTVEELEKLTSMQIQKDAIKLCRNFFKKESSDEDDDEGENPMDEDNEEMSDNFEFFLALFTKDADLRGYYEKNWDRGDFSCLVCAGTGIKAWKKFGDCVALVQHSISISKTVKRAAHRAFGQAICSILGWKIDQLPSIVLALAEPLGRTLDQTNLPADLRDDTASVMKENLPGEIVASEGSDVVQKENFQEDNVALPNVDQKENFQEDNVASPDIVQKENLQEDNGASASVGIYVLEKDNLEEENVKSRRPDV